MTSWSATGIGRTHLPVLAAALSLGGHLRVGMEDNVVYARGRQVRSNAELVERAARIATELQRPPLSTSADPRPARPASTPLTLPALRGPSGGVTQFTVLAVASASCS